MSKTKIEMMKKEFSVSKQITLTPGVPMFVKTGCVMNVNDFIIKFKLIDAISMTKPFIILNYTLSNSNELTLICLNVSSNPITLSENLKLGVCYYTQEVTFRTPQIKPTNTSVKTESKEKDISIDIN